MINGNSNQHNREARRLQIDSSDFRQDRARLLARVVDRMDAIGTDTDSRVYSLLAGGSDSFVSTVVGANRILTKTHQDEHDTNYLIPFNNIILDPDKPGYSHILPHPEDKDSLLKYLHATGVDMWRRGRSSEHIAAVVGYGINLIHPFTEANGRTARMVHDTLVHGTTSAEARFPLLAEDSVENTDSLNPEIIESYVYRQIQLGLGTHTLEDDVAVPQIGFAMSPPTMNRLVGRTSDARGSLTSPFDQTLATISNPETSAMLAYFMAEDTATVPAVKASIGRYGGRSILNLDHFLRLANNDDWNRVHTYARQISATYVVEALRILAVHPDYDPELAVTINTHEQGAMTLPISHLIQNLAQQKLHRKSWSYSISV